MYIVARKCRIMICKGAILAQASCNRLTSIFAWGITVNTLRPTCKGVAFSIVSPLVIEQIEQVVMMTQRCAICVIVYHIRQQQF